MFSQKDFAFTLQSTTATISSKEVGDKRARRNHVRLVGDRVKDLEFLVVVLVDLQYGRLIATPIAIVGSRPNGDKGLVEIELEALVDELMRTAHELQTIHVAKLFCDLGAK